MVLIVDAGARRATVTKSDGRKATVPVRLINVAEITIDSVYQRDLENTFIDEHFRDGWKEHLAQVLTLSLRGGRLFCIDGQHRLAGARQCGVVQVWAYVMEGLTQQEEADLFTQFQLKRRALKIWELFKADTAAQKKAALDISRAVHRSGFRIDRNNGVGIITAIGALTSIYKLGGEELLADTLTLIHRLWTLDDAMALRGQIMYGLAIFLYSFQGEPQFRIDRVETVLPITAPAKLLRLAQAIASRRSSATVGAANVGEALRDLYNKGIDPERRLGALRARSGKRRPA